MKIYLDNCCYNRPFDDQKQRKVFLEAQAKLFIQDNIKQGTIKLVSSYVLIVEMQENSDIFKRDNIFQFVKNNSSAFIGEDKFDEVENLAAPIIQTGIKRMDACHVAAAIVAKCDYLLTTDKRLLKYQTNKIKLVNPLEFIGIMEENDDE
ncbi:hypothetical protein AGMMS50276_20980 [Synergistales bacterium]|nr:hypothetical protein AGMMS50276_20980 [Synergistales bacterium]